MYLRLKDHFENRPHIRVAYSELVGKTFYCTERNKGGVTKVFLNPSTSRNVPDDWLESETDRVRDILDKYTDIGVEQESLYGFLSLSRAEKDERIEIWNEIDKYGKSTS